MANNGNKILIYNGSTLIGGMKSNRVRTDVDLLECASPATGRWKAYTTDRMGGEIQVGYLVLTDSALGVQGGNGVRDLLQMGNTFNLVFKERNAQDSAGVSGSYILKTCEIYSVVGNLVTGAFQFILNGEMT